MTKLYNYFAFLITIFTLLIFTNLFAKDIPVLVISPGKTLQSKSTVGSDVEVIDSETISNSGEFFIGDALDNNLNGMNYHQSGGYGTVAGMMIIHSI